MFDKATKDVYVLTMELSKDERKVIEGVLPGPNNLDDTSRLLARDGVSPLDLIIGGVISIAIGIVLIVRWYHRRSDADRDAVI